MDKQKLKNTWCRAHTCDETFAFWNTNGNTFKNKLMGNTIQMVNIYLNSSMLFYLTITAWKLAPQKWNIEITINSNFFYGWTTMMGWCWSWILPPSWWLVTNSKHCAMDWNASATSCKFHDPGSCLLESAKEVVVCLPTGKKINKPASSAYYILS